MWALGRGQSLAVTPADAADFNALCEYLLRLGRVVVLIDEASFWITARGSKGSVLPKLMRLGQQQRVALHLTTQHLTGDLPQLAVSCAPELCVFRCTSRTVLAALEKDWGMDPEVVRKLLRGQYLRAKTGF